MYERIFALAAAVLALAACTAAAPIRGAAASDADAGVPRYAHIVVIVEENEDYDQIRDPAIAPNLAGLAARYGDAAQFFAEAHPSEPNYVALMGGDTFGISDDDGFYCHAGMTDPACVNADEPGYVDHTVRASSLADQLAAAGLSWKGYYENLPAPGSLAVIAGDPKVGGVTRKTALYAAKHSGLVNFVSVQQDPRRAEHIVGFDQLDADLAANRLPNFALVVPNQCNDMHGLSGAGLPADCSGRDRAALVARGDKAAGDLVARLQATGAWRSPDNMAIVITFDEGAQGGPEGCCGSPPNAGGGHIPTIVITNHGPRGLKDSAPYNHYSLLRTLEDAFGVKTHLGYAAATDKGVAPMTPLFRAPVRQAAR